MNTPICDFVREYGAKNALRLHMPGHKGRGPLGVEALDITEIDGADVLYDGNGIIAESEANATALFGSGKTLYSAEGSSLSIRAMIDLARRYALERGQTPRILAARNAHKAFLSAVALLDVEVEWLYPGDASSLIACSIRPEALDKALSTAEAPFCAVYLTSPDYLGHMQDVAALAAICHAHDALCIVDNAHGAYLRFLPESRHPLDFGADVVCDSAHKTLPVLTGGGYLHLAANLPETIRDAAEDALRLFASTSPSWLILQSLDAANPYLAERLPGLLDAFLPKLNAMKARLTAQGFRLLEEEPLKITLDAKACGFTGDEMSRLLAEKGLVCEFADPDFLVMMLNPEWGDMELRRIEQALTTLPKREPIPVAPPAIPRPERVLTPRQAMLAAAESVPVEAALGRVLASAGFTCPPAIPIAIPGERLDETAIQAMRYYGIRECKVVKE